MKAIVFTTLLSFFTASSLSAQSQGDNGNLTYCQQQVFQNIKEINGLLSQLSQCNSNAVGYYVQSITGSEAYQRVNSQPSEYWIADCSNYNSFFLRWIDSINQSIANACR